ncbi:glycosyltransferase family 61 protein [Caballeronia telluris]|uniref:Glycosyltransferase 61 catalytic domain-containing protein n=1 Tax=Caballeronia telluris TaxID=326475 RepID=A0A158IXX9_9BURK|nr:glycosyltransferase family 61 protein [Caballeronia telluris]SAL61458.1 hypothetical protein AWB66_03544 [Caballeronia telluris]
MSNTEAFSPANIRSGTLPGDPDTPGQDIKTGSAEGREKPPQPVVQDELKLSDFLTELDVSVNLLFDVNWYLENNPGVAEAKVHPLGHYISFGARELRSPTPLFDPRYYVCQKPEVIDEESHPLEDYLRYGGFQGLDPNEFFDGRWYLSEYEDARTSGLNPLLHYIKSGERAGHWPSALFDPEAHKRENPDVDWNRVSPLAHFLARRGPSTGTQVVKQHFRVTAALRRFLGNVRPDLEGTPCSVELRVQSLEEFVQTSASQADGNEVLARPTSTVQGLGSSVAFPGAPLVAKLNDVIAVAGTRYVVTNLNTAIHDEEAHFADQPDVAVKWAHTRRLPRRRVVLECKARQGAWVESGIHLMLESANNYFHFLVEALPRLILAEIANVPPSVPLLVQDDLHPNIRALIDLANISRRPVLYLEPGTLYSVKYLYMASETASIPDAYFGGEAASQSAIDVERIRAAVRRCDGRFPRSSKSGNRKIFIGRGGARRVLTNQQQIEGRLVELGFEIVRVDDLDVETQIRLFRQASVVIAPTGAHLTNMLWCAPGTRVIVLSSDHTSLQLYLWELLGRVSGVSVSFVRGPRAYKLNGRYGVHDDYAVDVEAVAAAALTETPQR